MSERVLFSLFYSDKTITNPINKTEVFSCSDLYKDFKKCRALSKKGLKNKLECHEIRSLGQQCYIKTEEEFEMYLAKIFDEKRKYISYLKNEGSILYKYYRSDPTVFSLKKIPEMMDGTENDFNEHLTK